jgi:hypothetical protein
MITGNDRGCIAFSSLFFVSLFFLALSKQDTDAWTHLSFGHIISEQHGLRNEALYLPQPEQTGRLLQLALQLCLYRAFALLASRRDLAQDMHRVAIFLLYRDRSGHLVFHLTGGIVRGRFDGSAPLC